MQCQWIVCFSIAYFAYVCVPGDKNARFSENLACFVFLKHPFWDSPFCLITDVLAIEIKKNYQFGGSHVIFLIDSVKTKGGVLSTIMQLFCTVFEKMEHLLWTELRYLPFLGYSFDNITVNFHTHGMKKSIVFPVIFSTGLTYLTVFEPGQNLGEGKIN